MICIASINAEQRGPACGGVWAFPPGWGKDSGNRLCDGRVAAVAAVWQKVKTMATRMELPWFGDFRIYETLEYLKFSEMSLDDKREKVISTIEKLTRFKEMKLGTDTAKNLWLQRLDYYIGFYEKLKTQLENSTAIL